MDLVLIFIIFSLAIFIAVRTNRKSKEEDIISIEKEVINDFKTDFEVSSAGKLSPQGMAELVDWYEGDLRERKLEQSKEVESFDELK